jgi:poly(hydroxyalkanoate) depolymerase family esterase
MAGIRNTLSNLNKLRRKFQDLQKAERGRPSTKTQRHGPHRLRERTPDGINPGDLRMLVHVPDHLPGHPALVVALHGCGQTADDFDDGTGWSTLADRFGFIVIFPEQQASNNAKGCFSWFQPGDFGRDVGEARSIHEMVVHAISEYEIDRSRVFITGLSAGGAMAAVMLATYPEVYAGGAIIAGLPYGCARSVQEALQAMFTDRQLSPDMLGNRVRRVTDHQGPWPRVSVWHGTADTIVRPSNADHIVAQWTNVHGLPLGHTAEEMLGSHRRRTWEDGDGNILVEAISIAGMAHGVPLSSASVGGVGTSGPFFLDVGLSSTHHIVEYWGLGSSLVEQAVTTSKADVHRLAIEQSRSEGADGAHASGGSPKDSRHREPQSVITRAFEAAGLPSPRTEDGKAPSAQAIIEAALEAAGLKKPF